MRSERTLDALLAASRSAVEAVEQPDRTFDFDLAFSPTYDDLLAARFDATEVSLDEVLDAVRSSGRMLLSAPAASGKTSVLARLGKRAAQSGRLVVRVDLRKWTPALDREWRSLGESDVGRAALLLESVAEPAVTEAELGLAVDVGCLLLVDGLNEVPARVTRGVPWVLDALAARLPWVGVLASDRLQRRPLPSRRWMLSTITRVTDPGPGGGVAHNALMLDIARNTAASPVASEGPLLLEHVTRSAELSEPDLMALGEAALGLYRKHESRYFPLRELATQVGDDVVERLVSANTLRHEEAYGFFRHHLFHDVLAAQAVASDPQRWTSQYFDWLTFRSNSIDAVSLALELLDEPASADTFLMAVYDWNQYAAAAALSHGRRFNTIAVSEPLELAILGALAERRWDPIAPTVERVEDALRVFPGELAQRLLAAKGPNDVRELIAAHVRATGATPGWLDIFLGTLPPTALLDALRAGRPLEGWMAANALRDASLSELDVDRLAAAMEHSNHVVRWRAAHALGAYPSRKTTTRLLRALDRDDEEWVRYGALRSLIEQAGRDDGRRKQILREVRDRLPSIQRSWRLRGELERTLQLREPPIGWATAVEDLLIALMTTAETVADQDHWRRVGLRVSRSVERARASA